MKSNAVCTMQCEHSIKHKFNSSDLSSNESIEMTVVSLKH